ncbi:MAG: hypothetical protein PHO91_01780 [Patescibacteria group bacterium]|nr:hypothetical protein [Patescibacteria group bacterium]
MERFNQSTESGKSPEPERQKIEALINASLAHGIKFDEGQNAIVLEVDPDDFADQELLSDSEKEQIMATDPFVSKVLRVFSAGHSQKEALSQIEAGKILAEQSDENLAKVPEIYFHSDIEIKDEVLRDKLAKAGVETAGSQVGVLLMYRVKGVDFLNYLLQEAIKKCPAQEAELHPNIGIAQRALARDPRAMSTEEVFKTAAALIGFEEDERVRLNPKNRDRLFTYLQKHDFVLNPEIIARAEKAINSLNQNGFYHNDLTERNMMLEFDPNGQMSDIYLIDFEKSGSERDQDFGGEMAILSQYKLLGEDRDVRQQKELMNFFGDLEKTKLRVKQARSEDYKRLEETARYMLRAKDERSMSLAEKNALVEADYLLGGKAYELLAGILIDLSLEQSEQVKKYIDQRIQSGDLSVRYQNYLSRVRSKIQ